MSFRDFFLPGARDEAKQPQPFTEDEERILAAVAAKVVEWKMTVPAILFLESVKPLNYIGAQALVFFEPFVQTLFNFKDYGTFREMLERRESIERLLLKIEELDAAALAKERQQRSERKARRGGRGPFARWFRRTPSPGRPPTGGHPPQNGS